MFVFFSVLIVIIAIILVFAVIIQNSKGGGLASSFASSNQVMGVRKTTDFLEKATWWLAGSLVVLCIAASFFLPQNAASTFESQIKDEILNSQTPQDLNAIAPFETPITDGGSSDGETTEE